MNNNNSPVLLVDDGLPDVLLALVPGTLLPLQQGSGRMHRMRGQRRVGGVRGVWGGGRRAARRLASLQAQVDATRSWKVTNVFRCVVFSFGDMA